MNGVIGVIALNGVIGVIGVNGVIGLNGVIGVNGEIGAIGVTGVTVVNGLNSGISLTLVPNKKNNNNYMNLLLTCYECKPVKIIDRILKVLQYTRFPTIFWFYIMKPMSR